MFCIHRRGALLRLFTIFKKITHQTTLTRSPDIHIDFLNRLRQLTANRCPHMPENAVLSPFIESVEIHPDFLQTLGIEGASGIFFVEKGLVGVFHEFEGKSRKQPLPT